MFFGKKKKDPVCGMEVKVNGLTPHYNYNGTEYYFCSSNCLEQFEKNPGKYVDKTDESSHKGGHMHCC